MPLKPSQLGGRPGFVIMFNYPQAGPKTAARGKPVCQGLGTRDRTRADALCAELERLCRSRLDWQDPIGCLARYDQRVCEIFFGKDHPAFKNLPPKAIPVDDTDIDTLKARTLMALDTASAAGKTPAEAIEEVLKHFESTRFKQILQRCETLQNELTVSQSRLGDTRTENERLSRAQNKHVAEKIGDAYDAWKETDAYKLLSSKSQGDMRRTVETFIETLEGGRGFRLAAIRAEHVEKWLNGLLSIPKGERRPDTLSAVTKGKLKRCLSSFMGEIYRRYDLAENPMDKTGTVRGTARNPEDITAMRIDQLGAFQEMLDTLAKVDPYWHALVSTACLSGFRYSELAWIQLEHVNLEQGHIRVASRKLNGETKGTKTGRERTVPIETTTLKPFLVRWLSIRIAQQKNPRATEMERSPFLFPSTVPPNKYKPRTKTPPGLWSDSSTFLRAWREVAARCEKKTGKREYWSFGPADWRHCGGTAMGYSGNDSTRVSAWLGNSESICRRHYMRPSSSGALWPFKW